MLWLSIFSVETSCRWSCTQVKTLSSFSAAAFSNILSWLRYVCLMETSAEPANRKLFRSHLLGPGVTWLRLKASFLALGQGHSGRGEHLSLALVLPLALSRSIQADLLFSLVKQSMRHLHLAQSLHTYPGVPVLQTPTICCLKYFMLSVVSRQLKVYSCSFHFSCVRYKIFLSLFHFWRSVFWLTALLIIKTDMWFCGLLSLWCLSASQSLIKVNASDRSSHKMFFIIVTELKKKHL